MGSSGKKSPTKASKAAAPTQEEPQPQATSPLPSTGIYPDWPGYQAYSPYPPGHPYMWGPQHMMTPYGTPPPPYVMYPPGVYPHPSMPQGSHPFSPYAMPSPNATGETTGTVQVSAETDGKPSEAKKGSPVTKSSEGKKGRPFIKSSEGKKGGPEVTKGDPEGKKGGPVTRSKSQGMKMVTRKTKNNKSKKSKALANGAPKSGESGSEGSGDSRADSQTDSQEKARSGRESSDADATQNASTTGGSQNGLAHAPPQGMLNRTMAMIHMPIAGTSGAIGPTTHLNMGMDYWGSPTPSTIPPIHAEILASAVTGTPVPGAVPGSRENKPSEPWVNDEREQKRQKRKQSNRESARRSRLRKQAECEELAQSLGSLTEENTSLRAEVERIKKEHSEVVARNLSLKERLGVSEDTRAHKNVKDSDHNNSAAEEEHTDTTLAVS